jgi:hypothetical protein
MLCKVEFTIAKVTTNMSLLKMERLRLCSPSFSGVQKPSINVTNGRWSKEFQRIPETEDAALQMAQIMQAWSKHSMSSFVTTHDPNPSIYNMLRWPDMAWLSLTHTASFERCKQANGCSIRWILVWVVQQVIAPFVPHDRRSFHDACHQHRKLTTSCFED